MMFLEVWRELAVAAFPVSGPVKVVAVRFPPPLREATATVPAYHFQPETLVGTLNQTVPGAFSIPIA